MTIINPHEQGTKQVNEVIRLCLEHLPTDDFNRLFSAQNLRAAWSGLVNSAPNDKEAVANFKQTVGQLKSGLIDHSSGAARPSLDEETATAVAGLLSSLEEIAPHAAGAKSWETKVLNASQERTHLRAV